MTVKTLEVGKFFRELHRPIEGSASGRMFGSLIRCERRERPSLSRIHAPPLVSLYHLEGMISSMTDLSHNGVESHRPSDHPQDRARAGCPECGEPMIRESGCSRCVGCGESRCG